MKDLRRAVWLGLCAHAVLLAVALRHHFVWGAGRRYLGIELHVLLGIGEGLGLLLFTVLGAFALRHALVAARDGAAGGAGAGSGPDPPAAARRLLVAGAFVALAATAVPPFLSSDVFDYVARGRVEAHYGHNPYLTPPAAVPTRDPVLALAEWPEFVMPYGPVSALVQAGCAAAAGGTPWLGAYLFKALCAAAHVLTAWLLLRAAPSHGRAVFALWLFHPWILLESCGSAHNEALVALCLAWMLERIARDRWAMATVAFGLAVLTKHGCAPLGPLLLAAAWRCGRLVPFLTGVGATAAVTALCAWRYFTEPGALDFLAKQTGNRGTSLQHFATLVLGPGAEQPLLLAGYGVTLLAVVLACWRTRAPRDLARHGIAVLLVFIVCAMPLFSPWYHLWWAPLVALLPLHAGGTMALRVLVWLGPLSYGVYATTRGLGLPHQVFAWTLACLAPALVAFCRGAEPEKTRADGSDASSVANGSVAPD